VTDALPPAPAPPATAPGAGAGAAAARPPGNTVLMRVVLVALVALLAFTLLRGLFGHHDTQYERVAFAVTAGLELNDISAVQKFQNAETATHLTREIVGRASDAFVPLGALERVRETSEDPELRIHQFDAVFDKGVVHETIRFDPDGKVVSFKYDPPITK
jgi:hypothetical protein